MNVIKRASEIKACCASCNGSGYSGGVDGFAKKVKILAAAKSTQNQRAA